jgi:hypothetical protein
MIILKNCSVIFAVLFKIKNPPGKLPGGLY